MLEKRRSRSRDVCTFSFHTGTLYDGSQNVRTLALQTAPYLKNPPADEDVPLNQEVSAFRVHTRTLDRDFESVDSSSCEYATGCQQHCQTCANFQRGGTQLLRAASGERRPSQRRHCRFENTSSFIKNSRVEISVDNSLLCSLMRIR